MLGLAFYRSGQLYVCDSKLGAVFLIKVNGEVELFADKIDDRKLQMPNFLVFDEKGGLYVSDSGTAKAVETTGAVFYFSPNGMGRVFLDKLVFPNGLALAKEDRALYVVQTRDNCLLRVPIEEDGAAGEPVMFAERLESGPDGVALDVHGNIYVTVTRPSQIVKVSPEGDKKILLADPSNELLYLPSNVAFGGPQNRHLYIANLFGQHITRLEINEPGLPLFSQR